MKKNKIILLTSIALISSFPFTITSCDNNQVKMSLSIKTPESSCLNVGQSMDIEFNYEGFDDVTSIKLVSVDESVLSVKNHTITGVKEGFSYIYATYGSLTSERIKIDVQEVDVTIKLSIETPSSTSLFVGDSLSLKINSENIKDTSKIRLESSNPDVISVNGNTIVAKKAGSSKISAVYEEYSSASIEFNVAEKASISLKTPSKTTLNEGDSLTLEPVLKNATDTENIKIVSSNSEVISVDNFTIKALKVGTSKIYATYKDLKTEEIEFTVVEKKELVVGIVTPSKTNIKVDETIKLVGDVKNNDENYPLVWSSSNTNVATIDSDGNLKGLSIGTTNITLTVNNVISNPILITVEAGDPTSVKITSRKDYIGVGEELEIGCSFLPLESSDTYTITSSNESYIEVEGNKIIGKKITGEDEKITITLTTSKGLVDTLSFEVKSFGDSAIDELSTLLTNSIVKEKVEVKTGNFNYKKIKSDDSIDTNNEISYEVFDNKVESNGTYVSSYSTENIFKSVGIKDDKIYFVEKNDDGYTNLTNCYDLVESGGVSYNGTYNRSEASDVSAMPIFTKGNNSSNMCGVSNNILKYVKTNTSYFSSSDAKKTIDFSYENGVYNISSSYNSSTLSNGYDCNLSLKFDSGLLVEGEGTFVKYITDDDSGKRTSKDSTETVSFGLTRGERRKGEVGFDYDSLYLTDYNAYFYKGYGSNKTITNDYYVGETPSLEISNTTPSTYSKNVDEVTILSVSDSEAATISTSKKYLTFNKAINGLVVTVSSKKGIKKEITLNCSEKPLEKIGISSSRSERLPSRVLVGDEKKIKIIPTPSIASLSLQYEFIKNEAEATCRVEDNYLYLTGAKAGECTIKIYDTKLDDSLAITKTVQFYENSDAGLMNMFDGATLGTTNSYFSDISLSIDKENKTGSLSFSYDGDDFSASFDVTDQKFTFKNFTGGSDYSIESIVFGTDSSISSISRSHDFIRVTLIDDLGDYTYPSELYIK